MASLRKKPNSAYWFACFSLPDGQRVQRSTKVQNRKEAQKIADLWEEAAKQRMRAKQMHKVMADIFKHAHGDFLPSSSVKTFLNEWLVRRKREVKPASFKAYQARSKAFLTWLDKESSSPINQLPTSIFIRYRDHLASKLSNSTANQSIKVLRSMFEDARRDGYLAENPVKDVRPLKCLNDKLKRRPFTMDELRSVLSAADDEWKSMILFGLYTGQRLADLARLRWSNLDTIQNELRLQTGKTGRIVIIPLCQPLVNHISNLDVAEFADAFIHPRAATHVKLESGQASALSRQFADILASAGLRDKTKHSASKNGRSGKHEMASLSFHCLRHTATSIMKNAGVSPAIVQDIIGHDSAEISAHYTHIDNVSKRQALEAIPDILGA